MSDLDLHIKETVQMLGELDVALLVGSEDYNIKLSESRAKAVYDLIIASGVDASRVSFKGYGEDTSVDKSSADARQMARRASFEVK